MLFDLYLSQPCHREDPADSVYCNVSLKHSVESAANQFNDADLSPYPPIRKLHRAWGKVDMVASFNRGDFGVGVGVLHVGWFFLGWGLFDGLDLGDDLVFSFVDPFDESLE